MDLACYHGPLAKRDCESLLLAEGRDGNFLLRDSETLPGALCLCVSFKNFVYTYRIFREKDGGYHVQTVEGAPKLRFQSLKELVSKFKKPGQGLVVPLRQPIPATRPLRWRRSKTALDSISENCSSDYVEVLP